MAAAILGAAALFFGGHFLSWVFKQTKFPDLLILVSLGYLLGPGLGWLTANDFGKSGNFISTLALIVILYEGGVRLSARDLLTSSLPALLLTVLGAMTIVVLTFFLCLAFLLPLHVSLLIALAVGSTSSAIVIPMVRNLSIEDHTKTVLSLESAFTDVLTIVLFLVALEAVQSGQVSVSGIVLGLGPYTLQAAVMGIGFGVVWALLKAQLGSLVSMAFANEAWALLTYSTVELAGFNGAIGVLALGFLLGNLELLPDWMRSRTRDEALSAAELSLLSEVAFLLRTFFFLYLGILIQFNDLKSVALAALISLGVVVTRYASVKIIFSGTRKLNALDELVSIAMGPRGLACAVLASLPLQRGITNGAVIQNTLFAMIPMTITLTALAVAFLELRFKHHTPKK